MPKKNNGTPPLKFSLKETIYGIKYPLQAVKKIPTILKYRNLYLKTRNVEGLLSWDAGIMLHNIVMESKHPSPNIVEIGSYQGKSTIFLAYASKKKGKKVCAFEWFKGLVEVDRKVDTKYSGYESLKPDEGKFDKNLRNSELRDIVDMTVGDARETLIPKIKDGGFSVAFLDVDLYNVTLELLDQLMSVAVGGEVIVIHDYDWPGIKKAINEFSSSYRGKIKHTLIKENSSLNSAIFRLN